MLESEIEKSINSVPPQRKPYTSEEYIASIEKAEKEIEEGRYFTTEQAKARLGL